MKNRYLSKADLQEYYQAEFERLNVTAVSSTDSLTTERGG